MLATEGTVETGIYYDIFSRYDIPVKAQGREDYAELRYFIEAVKQNTISAEVMPTPVAHDAQQAFPVFRAIFEADEQV